MYSRGRQLIQLSRQSQSLPAATDDVFRVPGSGEEQAHKLMISQSWSCIEYLYQIIVLSFFTHIE